MNLILQMLLSATSMRCAARIIDIISNVLQIPTQAPSWYTARIWLLRLGYYKLMRPKVISDDWIWIVDHSVQLGTEKCLLILGIRQKDLPVGRALTYSDVEPIELIPSVKSNGQIVYEQLTRATVKTGVPTAIVSDAGPDLNAGINLFIQNNIETRRIYDVKHMVALVLKKVLTADEAWIEFIDKASTAKLNMQQTNVAALAPPNQRSKCRYMNLDKLINWAMKIILMSDDKIADIVDLELKRKNLDSWMFFFVHHIKRWKRINDNAQLIIKYASKNGLYIGLTEDLNKQLGMISQCEESSKFANVVLDTLKKQEEQIPAKQRLLCSSDIIESVFGKFKNIEKEQSSSGFTNLLLALPALVGATTIDTIKTVFDKTRVTNVWDWMKNNIGVSLQGKRNFCFAGL